MVRLLFIGLAIGLLQACTLLLGEESFILNDNRLIEPSAATLNQMRKMSPGAVIDEVSIQRQDGHTARGIWVKQPQSDTVIVYFAGNAMRIADSFPAVFEQFHPFHTDLVWLDHRGKGWSDGLANVENLLQDALGTYDYVKARSHKKILVHGFSLGSFIAGHIMAYRPVAGAVLEASATNVEDWIQVALPWYMRYGFKVQAVASLSQVGNDKVVVEYKGPLLLLVGEHDRTIPASLTRKLFELSRSSQKQMLIVPEGGHGHALADPDARQRYKQFLQVSHYSQLTEK